MIFIWLDFLYFATAAKAVDDFTGTPYPLEMICFMTETATADYGGCGKQDEENGCHTKHGCYLGARTVLAIHRYPLNTDTVYGRVSMTQQLEGCLEDFSRGCCVVI